MTPPPSLSNEQLRALLRSADPAAGSPAPSPQELALLLRRLQAAETAPRPRPLQPAWAAAGLVFALAVLGVARLGVGPTPPPTSPPAQPKARHIEFVTHRGTRILWILDPSLDL